MAIDTFEHCLTQIKSAIYGEEVRDAIVAALRFAYNNTGEGQLTPAEVTTAKKLINQLGPKVDQIEPHTITLGTISDADRSQYGNSVVRLGTSLNSFNRVVFYFRDNVSHEYGSTEFYNPDKANNGFNNFIFDLSAIEASSVVTTYLRRQRFIVESGGKLIHTWYDGSGDHATLPLGGGGLVGFRHGTYPNSVEGRGVFDGSVTTSDIIFIYKVIGYTE